MLGRVEIQSCWYDMLQVKRKKKKKKGKEKEKKKEQGQAEGTTHVNMGHVKPTKLIYTAPEHVDNL